MLNCRDELLGRLIKDLLDTETNHNVTLIYQKYDQLLLEEDPLFYYKLSSQFYKERKTKAALDILHIYEYFLAPPASLNVA